DGRRELQSLGHRGGHRQREERVPGGLGGADSVVPDGLGVPGTRRGQRRFLVESSVHSHLPASWTSRPPRKTDLDAISYTGYSDYRSSVMVGISSNEGDLGQPGAKGFVLVKEQESAAGGFSRPVPARRGFPRPADPMECQS